MIFNKRILIILILFILFFGSLVNISFADELPIYSGAAILIDANSGDVLYEKNSNSLMYPASTTKILTAILALEHCNLSEKATASNLAVSSIKSGYTNANIQIGEELSIEDLLYALLLKSANEAANIIAEHVGGTIENFANMMNEKAIILGCQNTHFVTPNGIHDENHVTTAADLAIIARYCMQNETFRKIVSTNQYTLPATEQYPNNDRILKNSNSLLISGHTYYYPYATGIKTGFTTQAKNCLIASSSKDDLDLISIVLHAEATDDGRSARYLDTINLLEYGNNNYKSYTIINKDEIVENIEIKVSKHKTKTLNLIANQKIKITLPNSENLDISSSKITLNDDLSAPIEKGQIIGKIDYSVNQKNFSTELIAENNIYFEENNINLIKIIIIIFIMIMTIIFIIIKKFKFSH